ncbi:MAG: pentapeptide repeat-containing protein [Caldilineaceae bacterium]
MDMRRWLYRLYLYAVRANMELRQRLFYLFYLRPRKAERLEGADLSYLNLMGTNLRGANLRTANLRRADLRGVSLAGADLSGADLTGAQVTEEQLGQAKSLAGATLPDGTVQVGERQR